MCGYSAVWVLTLSSPWGCCVGNFMDLCPQMRFLFLFSLCTASGAVRGVLSDFRLKPSCWPWCLAVNSASQSWHYTLVVLSWITDVLMELISETENIQWFVPGIFLLCSGPGLSSPGWSCSPAGLHSGHTAVLVSETLPGHGGWHCLGCHAVQHHLVSPLLL